MTMDVYHDGRCSAHEPDKHHERFLARLWRPGVQCALRGRIFRACTQPVIMKDSCECESGLTACASLAMIPVEHRRAGVEQCRMQGCDEGARRNDVYKDHQCAQEKLRLHGPRYSRYYHSRRRHGLLRFLVEVNRNDGYASSSGNPRAAGLKPIHGCIGDIGGHRPTAHLGSCRAVRGNAGACRKATKSLADYS